MRRILPVCLAAVVFSGCGYVGNPMPPLANIPAAVQDLGAEQRGGSILAQFTLPLMTTESMPIRKALRIDLRIGTAASPLNPDSWAASARAVSGARYDKDIVRFEIPAADWAGKTAVVGVRTIGQNGKPSAWSNFVTLPVVAPPETPQDVRATDTPQGVQVVWSAHGDSFRVFRRAGEEGDFAEAATVQQPEWTDPATEFGKLYAYRVQTVVKLAGGREALSEFSDTATVTPQDVFPPAVPTGLTASPAPSSVELTWNANSESTLGGYNVYRAAGTGAFERIAENIALPAYSDRAAAHGAPYRYAITAVSKSGHESPRSEAVEITLP